MKPHFSVWPLFFMASTILANPDTLSVPSTPAITSTASGKSVIVIEPKARAQDWVQAFDLLRRDKPAQKIIVRTYSGMTLSNVIDLTVSPGGTLFFIKVMANQGSKYQIVPVEELLEVAYSPF